LNRFFALARNWLLVFLACFLSGAFVFVFWDVPVAAHFSRARASVSLWQVIFAGPVILAVQSVVVVSLILARLVRGRISRVGETLAIACLASICTYCVNDGVLKPLLGVPGPADVFEGARHAFNLMEGSVNASFPSGHMTLAGAFAGVFMRANRGSIRPLTILLAFGGAVLVIGDWHFLSDVIAGAFVGVSAGLLAGEAWIVHSHRLR
jgi:membrane-associated phospholipid phosphatase